LHSSNQQYEAASSKNLAKKAETIENTRKTVDILIGAACHSEMTFGCQVTAQARSPRQQRSFFVQNHNRCRWVVILFSNLVVDP